MKTSALWHLLFLFLLPGCAGPGFVQTGPDTYMLSVRSYAGGFANMPELKARAIRRANEFAESKGKQAVIVSANETFPTHGFPSYDYHFRLAAK